MKKPSLLRSEIFHGPANHLFQRFFYFLEDGAPQEQGIIVFDELEKAQSHILIEQSHKYFKDTAIGRRRASLVIPEPLFVHSDLTTGIQVADLIAYCISWGFRTPQMRKPARADLARYSRRSALCDAARDRRAGFASMELRPHFRFAYTVGTRNGGLGRKKRQCSAFAPQSLPGSIW